MPKHDLYLIIAAAIVSAVISTILVLILLGLCLAYLYVYGRRNPGGWAEQIPYFRE
jgi:hypothetical protein